MLTLTSKILMEKAMKQSIYDNSLNKKFKISDSSFNKEFKNSFSPKENKFNFPENIKKKVGYLSLEERIKEAKPFLPTAIISHLKGKIGEKMMDTIFKNSGWSKIEGEVGRNGIDGLYIKRDKDKNIKQVLIAESKYNKSTLGKTLDGKQMSKDWIIAKIDNLMIKYPENKDYLQVKDFVLKDKYRSRFFHINEINGKLKIEISKIENDGKRDVKIGDLKGNEQMKINNFKEININEPKNKYEKNIAENYFKNVNDVINNKKEQHG